MSGHVSGDGGDPAVRVLYNAECPVCRFEIDHYRGRVERDGLGVGFDDLNDADALARWGIDADAAARRLHVVRDGRVLAGMDAFRALWSEMPHMRWAARAAGWPGLRQGLDWLYERVGAPLLYRSHLRRQGRG
ncbi:DUF393 domain-containing protein [Jannaschia sp. Os4]|uniref:thiol-disulfide oxidoreductase DCC family protein n=1 Tax=Jannaschia sp. Os4 TaxID=2807617 RepID=UPI001939F5A6|nr:DUF393 domain-containing protein [Jannaschia sp. Os4]MBM2577410.1 DUF393 domain-containing protein [Jannaschia sp. Os4]